MAEATAAVSGKGILRIYHLPVGQGSATLIVGPDNTAVLVDAGKGGEKNNAKILALLDKLQIKQLSWVIATHNHADHIGGFARGRGGPKSVLFGKDGTPGKAGVDDDNDGVTDWGPAGKCGEPAPDPEEINAAGSDDVFPAQGIAYGGETCDDEGNKIFRRFYEIIHARPQTKIITFDTYENADKAFSMPINLGSGAKLRFVIGNGYVAGQKERLPGINDPNEKSIGVYVEYGGFDYFIGGDLGAREEKAIGDVLVSFSDSPKKDPADAFQVGHHGSEGSSDEEFLSKIKPETAVISVGRNNFGHPAGIVLLRLAQISGMRVVFMTDKPEGNFFIAPSYADRVQLIISEAPIVITTDGKKTYTIEAGQGFNKTYPVDQ